MMTIFEHLSPGERLGELLFGLIIPLTFTLGAGIAVGDSERASASLLYATLGCNVAWGIIDGASSSSPRWPGLHRRFGGFRAGIRCDVACGDPYLLTGRRPRVARDRARRLTPAAELTRALLELQPRIAYPNRTEP